VVVGEPGGEAPSPSAASSADSAPADDDKKKEDDKDKPAEKPLGDPQSEESKTMRSEMDLWATRFRYALAEYEKDLEEQRLDAEKAKIKRKLENDRRAEEVVEVQQELEKLKLEVELQKRRAEVEQLKVEAELAKARAEKSKIEQSLQVEDIREKLEERVLGEEKYPDEPFKDGVLRISLRRIELNGPIFGGAADYVCQRLDYYNNQSDKPIFLVIDECPGGSATEGFQIVQAMKRSKAPVHVVVKRMAASMAAIIATLADHSYCYPDAIILHHQASTMLMGTGRNMEDQMRTFKEISHRLIGAVAKKVGLTEQQFVDEMYKNRVSGDWDLFGDQAVEKGWIESIATTIREEGVRSMPKGMRQSETLMIMGQSEGNSTPAAQGYLERFEVQLHEETDREGRRFVKLPRLSPLDAWLIYNPDGYYR
jgi:ATP-dependent Clp protease protease subunit